MSNLSRLISASLCSFSLFFLLGVSIACEAKKTLIDNTGQDVAEIIQPIVSPNSYTLSLFGFTDEELSGLPTYILSHVPQAKLILNSSSQEKTWFVMVLTNHDYYLQSTLSASQLNQLIQQYFTRQNVVIDLQYSQISKQVNVKRNGNPYIVFVTSMIVLFLLILAICFVIIRRQYLNYYLHYYGSLKNANDWLTTYNSARFFMFGLHKKWGDQLQYWLELAREANELAEQAKVYFEAGDIATAKLFANKALHSNSANEMANILIGKIEDHQQNTQATSENEEWIHSTISKAMQHYRQQEPLKALHNAYQAYERANQLKDLNTQAKAINVLINKIKSEFVSRVSTFTLNSPNDSSNYVFCQNQIVHIGRLSQKEDSRFSSKQEGVFYVNHKSVSRIGQQCQIQGVNNGFELLDKGSKNGTLHNQDECQANQAYSLKTGDIIQLGAKTIATAVRLLVNLSHNGDVLQLSYTQQAGALLDKQAFKKIWPDYSSAISTELVCVKQSCFIFFNCSSRKIVIKDRPESHENGISSDKPSATVKQDELDMLICEIKLGNKAIINPPKNANKMYVNSVPLVGEVPLILPCTISFEGLSHDKHSVNLSSYNDQSNTLTNTSLPTNNSVP